MLGQSARFERFAANMLYMIAAGKHIDTDRTSMFGEQVDEVYKNPFKAPKEELTAEEIIDNVINTLMSMG